MSKFVILLGGDISPTDRLKQQVQGGQVIAADSGIRHARALGLEVGLWVGDFDSASKTDVERFETVKREPWDADKDLTDGEIAISRALEAGASSLLLVGAMGGRTDHATAHLLKSFSLPARVLLTSGLEEGIPLSEPQEIDWPTGIVFSILAFDDLKGVSIKGARWPLDNADIPFGAGITLSNEVNGKLQISVASGRALAIANLS